MKMLVALALAGASMLACGQAQAALLIEFYGTATVTQQVWRGGNVVSANRPLAADFGGSYHPEDFWVGPGGLAYGGGVISPASSSPNFRFEIDGLPIYATAPTNGWVALPGTGEISYIIGDFYTGNATVLYGDVASAFYRVTDTTNSRGWNVSASVPEPATWAMMIAGFGLAGAALRQRKRAVLAHA